MFIGTVDRNGNKNGSKNFVQEKSSVLEIGIGNRDDLINSVEHPKYKAPPPPPRQRRTSSSSTTIKASTVCPIKLGPQLSTVYIFGQ